MHVLSNLSISQHIYRNLSLVSFSFIGLPFLQGRQLRKVVFAAMFVKPFSKRGYSVTSCLMRPNFFPYRVDPNEKGCTTSTLMVTSAFKDVIV